MKTVTQSQLDSVAFWFIAIFCCFSGTRVLADVQRVNRVYRDNGLGCCATQDHCDANEAMMRAMVACGYRADVLLDDLAEEEGDHITDVWNMAWDVARGWLDGGQPDCGRWPLVKIDDDGDAYLARPYDVFDFEYRRRVRFTGDEEAVVDMIGLVAYENVVRIVARVDGDWKQVGLRD